MEYRKKCNVCNHIWCYSDKDISDNNLNSAAAALSSISAVANVFAGTRYNAYEQTKLSNRASDKVIDFNKCPNCNSTNIRNLTEKEFETSQKETKLNTITINANASIESLIKRIEMFLEDEEFDNADAYCNQALDMEPDNGYLWLLKIVIENNWKIINKKIDFNNNYKKIEDSKNFNKVDRFKNDEISTIINFAKDDLNNYLYNDAVNEFNNSKTINEFENTIEKFENLNKFKESAKYINDAKNQIDIIKQNQLNELKELAITKSNSESKKDLKEALKIIEQNKELFKDADEKIRVIKEKIKIIETNTMEEQKEKSRKTLFIVLLIIIMSYSLNFIIELIHH